MSEQSMSVPFRWAEFTAASVGSSSVALASSTVGFVFDRVVRAVGGAVVCDTFPPLDLFPLAMVEGQREADFRFPPALVGFLCPPSLLLLVPNNHFPRFSQHY